MKNTNGKNLRAESSPLPKKPAFFSLFSLAVFSIAAALVCAILFWGRPSELNRQEFVLEEPALSVYFSPLDFSFVDEPRTAALRAEKAKTVPLTYKIDETINKKITEQTGVFFRDLQEIQKEMKATGEYRWKDLPFQIPTNSLEALRDETLFKEVKTHVANLLAYYLAQGIFAAPELSRLRQSGEQAVWVVAEGDAAGELKRLNNFLTKEAVLREAPEKIAPEAGTNARNITLQIFDAAISENLVLDPERTETARKKAAATVAPVEIKVKKNELIVQRGMLVTQEIKDRLGQIHKRLVSRKQMTQTFAGVLLVAFLYGLSFFYFVLFEPKSFLLRSRLLLFHAVVLSNVLICKAMVLWPEGSIYLMPTALASLLLTLLVSSRSGLWAGAMMVVLSGFLSAFRADVVLGTLLASAAATFLAYRVRKRIHFLRVGFGIGAVYFLALWGFQVAQNVRVGEAFHTASLGFGNGLFVVVLSFLMLPFLEAIFDVVTDITLLEHSDLNHPLMQKMMVQAPGTYHHSLVVSSLAEHACERVGANALLAKVGCYFHDIGKIERPEYFSENQGYLYPNLHDRLLPQLSYEIIVDHVRNGLLLGRKHKLKRAIMDFIAEHQGSSVIYYFYKKAIDGAPAAAHVRADDYRYPGPKPQSKETAVVLLADSVEAASRSLKETTPEAIQQLVRKIINDKFIDGQLDECELTLADLYRIQESFVRNMIAMFHTRMRYPNIENHPGAPDLFKENQFSKFRAKEDQ